MARASALAFARTAARALCRAAIIPADGLRPKKERME